MCVSDHAAAGMSEETRRDSAESDLENARAKRSDPEKELAQIEKELEEVQSEHRQLEAGKDSAEKQLKELMARFKLRKALLHWRHRKLTLSFRSLVTMVFRTRVEEAKRLKDEAIAKKKKLAKGTKGDEGDALLRVGKVEDVAGRTRELRRQPSGSGATFCWPPGMVRTKITWSGANCA
jgi:septal ring factor EnvC (AmiA/AmiB activator)